MLGELEVHQSGGGGGVGWGEVRGGGGSSGLMNVRSVLITPLNYINPPSELRRVTGTEGSEVSEVKPLPPPLPPPSPHPKSLSSH